MTGGILTGDDTNDSPKVVGKFTADFIETIYNAIGTNATSLLHFYHRDP